MKFKELQSMNEEQLAKKEEEITMELIKLKAQSATGTTIKSPGQIKELKKTLAKIKTIKKQKEKN